MRPQQRTRNRRIVDPTTPPIIPDLEWTVARPSAGVLEFTFSPPGVGFTCNGVPAFTVNGNPSGAEVVGITGDTLTVQDPLLLWPLNPLTIAWPTRDPAVRSFVGGFVAAGVQVITTAIPRISWSLVRTGPDTFDFILASGSRAFTTPSGACGVLRTSNSEVPGCVETGTATMQLTFGTPVLDGEPIAFIDGSAGIWSDFPGLPEVKVELAPA